MASDIKMKIKKYSLPSFADYEIGEFCHLEKVEIFQRRHEDAVQGTHTVFSFLDGNIIHQDRDLGGNYSNRRNSIALHFWSETEAEPNDKFVMCIFQHQGNEYIKILTLAEFNEFKVIRS